MATAIKKCRVCGKDYPACRSARRGDGVFRWKEVACSPECGAIYLARVLEARGEAENAPETKQAESAATTEAQVEKTPVAKRGRKKKVEEAKEDN